MAYLLDANVFISAKNLHYGLDFCPAFWDSCAALIMVNLSRQRMRNPKLSVAGS